MTDPRRQESSGYHIFVEPVGGVRDELQELITTLGGAHGGPVFPPHITIAGPIAGAEEEIAELAKELAHTCEPFSLTLGALGGEESFFRALYVRIEDADPLAMLHTRARSLFGLDEPRAYVPHLSLFYGTITDEMREQMKKTISYPQGRPLLVDRLHLYRTDGAAETWEKTGEYPLCLDAA